MSKFKLKQLSRGAIVAALYATLTLLLPVPQYGGVQFRFAEALTVLPFFLPEAIPGLAVGCLLSNLASPMALDWFVGTAATTVAGLLSQRVRSKYLAPLPPVLLNAVLIGAEIAYFFTDGAFLPAFALNAATVALGECVVCYGLGLVVIRWMEKNRGLWE